MYPELFSIGPVAIPSYTFFIDLGLLTGLALMLWRGRREGRALKWLDVWLAGVTGGVIGARALHVALHWDYFRENAGEILKLWAGGLEWHGALAGALIAGYIAARRLEVHIPPLLDVLALALPIGAALGWTGCLLSTCGYGQEVRSLADYPPLVVAELPDLYYTVAPRFNTQLFAIGWSLATLGMAAVLRWWVFQREPAEYPYFWWVLAFYSLGMLLIAGLRGDEMPMVAGVRLDQWLDAAVIGGCIAAWVRGTRHLLTKHKRNTI